MKTVYIVAARGNAGGIIVLWWRRFDAVGSWVCGGIDFGMTITVRVE